MEKILVLDDNEDILTLVLMILELEGYETKGISTAVHFLKTVEEFNPNLVLLDVLLGDGDGRVLCNALKSNPSTSHLPVIMISASHAAFSLPEDYYAPDDFISKPFDIDDLVARVKKVLAKG